MSDVDTARNLLLERTCDNCSCEKDMLDKQCVQYLGEAFGWQWWEMDESGTCDSWK